MFRVSFIVVLSTLFFNLNASTESQLNLIDRYKSFNKNSELVPEVASAEFRILEVNGSRNYRVRSGGLGEVFAKIDGIIAMGEKMWKIIEDGKPVVNYDNAKAQVSVLPFVEGEGPVPFQSMEDWQNPTSVKYEVVFKNLFGNEVVKFIANTTFQSGGSYLGKGSYINQISVDPEELSVLWGYNFDASVEVLGISNHSSLEDPMAGATILLKYKVKTVIKDTTTSIKFHVRGDGEFSIL